MIFLSYKGHHFLQAESANIQFEFIKLLSLLLLISLCSISYADAQINRLEIGDRVRVTAPFVDPMERIKGTVSEMSGSVLVLSKRDSLIYISDSLIQNLEVSTGKKRVIGRGLLIGAVATTVLFGATAAIINNSCGPGDNDCSVAKSNGAAFVSGGAVGLLSGAVAGAITGFFIKIDNWERTPVHVALGVAQSDTRIDDSSLHPKLSFRIPFGD